MKANLIAVQRTWWLLVLSSLGLSGLAAVGLQDTHTHGALRELRDLDRRFDPALVSDELTDLAKQSGRMLLSSLRPYLDRAGLQRIHLQKGAVIDPLVELQVQTLGSARTHLSSQRVPIYRADLAAIADGISFYLAQEPRGRTFTLQKLTLRAVNNSEEEVMLLQEAEQLRRQLVALDGELLANEHREARLQGLYKARLRMGITGQLMQQNLSDLFAVRKTVKELQATQRKELSRFQTLSERVRHIEAVPQPAAALQPPVMAQARVTLIRRPAARRPVSGQRHLASAGAGRSAQPRATRTDLDAATDATTTTNDPRLQLSFMLRLVKSHSTVPQLTGLSFSATDAAELWSDVADLDPKAAIACVESKLGPVSRERHFAGLTIGGPLLLQLGPFPLLLLLWLVGVRAQRTGEGYDPFSRGPEALPRLGLQFVPLNALSLIVLPSGACMLASLALWTSGHPPVLALPAGLACVVLGLWAHRATHSAIDMTTAISRSIRPPG